MIWQEIPDKPRQRSPHVHFLHPKGSVEIVPVQQDDGNWIWQFSVDTVATLRPLFMALEDMPMDARVLRAGMALARVLKLRTDVMPIQGFGGNATFIWPLRLIFINWIGLFGLRRLGLPQHVDIPLRVAIGVVLSVAGAWFLYHLIDKISALFEAQSRRYKFRDEILRSLLTSIAKMAVLIGAVLFLAEILSMPYQGVVAGLGIGGLAVALAARWRTSSAASRCSPTNPST